MAIQEHTPVMVREVVRALNIKDGGIYIDATFGRGGHTRAILDQLDSTGRVVAIDRDPESCHSAQELFPEESRLTVAQRPFSDLSKILDEYKLSQSVIGILIDLGVCSTQLDESSRGFSFLRQGPLDMRMDPSSGETAADWLGRDEEKELYRVLRDLGEERFARRIAGQVIRQRKVAPIRSTEALSKLVSDVVPTRERGKHPATRSFQAIRMHINRELEELKAVLPQAINALMVGGRLAVISFHSLEDRLVKLFMRDAANGDIYPPDVPITQDLIRPVLRIVGKPVRPMVEEVSANPRARSAILRVAEKIELAT